MGRETLDYTIRELAEKIGLPVDALVKQLQERHANAGETGLTYQAALNILHGVLTEQQVEDALKLVLLGVASEGAPADQNPAVDPNPHDEVAGA